VDIKKEFIAREEEKAVALFTANIARSRTDWDALRRVGILCGVRLL
jgi:hypothetical protein